ncbi:MAG: helix-turn-helix domain-containing protein [Oscillospiraceae bacterium]
MEIITVKELAELLRVGINNAYRLVHDGTIKSVRVGRVYRIPRKAVDEYLSQTSESCA